MVSIQTIKRCLNSFHYTLKVANSITAARNVQSTINQFFTYVQEYCRLEITHPAEDFVFINEVGFAVSTRPKRGRSEPGKRAITTLVSYARSRSISIGTAMNKNMILYFKVGLHDCPVKAVDFQTCLIELKTACTNAGIETPIPFVHAQMGSRSFTELRVWRL